MNVNDFRKLTRKKTRSKAELNAVFATCEYLKLKGLIFMVDLKDKLNARQFAMYKGLTIDGMLDIIILKTNKVFSGLVIEMKEPNFNITKAILSGNKHITEQNELMKKLVEQNYFCAFCAGFDHAKDIIDNYLNIN